MQLLVQDGTERLHRALLRRIEFRGCPARGFQGGTGMDLNRRAGKHPPSYAKMILQRIRVSESAATLADLTLNPSISMRRPQCVTQNRRRKSKDQHGIYHPDVCYICGAKYTLHGPKH